MAGPTGSITGPIRIHSAHGAQGGSSSGRPISLTASFSLRGTQASYGLPRHLENSILASDVYQLPSSSHYIGDSPTSLRGEEAHYGMILPSFDGRYDYVSSSGQLKNVAPGKEGVILVDPMNLGIDEELANWVDSVTGLEPRQETSIGRGNDYRVPIRVNEGGSYQVRLAKLQLKVLMWKEILQNYPLREVGDPKLTQQRLTEDEILIDGFIEQRLKGLGDVPEVNLRYHILRDLLVNGEFHQERTGDIIRAIGVELINRETRATQDSKAGRSGSGAMSLFGRWKSQADIPEKDNDQETVDDPENRSQTPVGEDVGDEDGVTAPGDEEGKNIETPGVGDSKDEAVDPDLNDRAPLSTADDEDGDEIHIGFDQVPANDDFEEGDDLHHGMSLNIPSDLDPAEYQRRLDLFHELLERGLAGEPTEAHEWEQVFEGGVNPQIMTAVVIPEAASETLGDLGEAVSQYFGNPAQYGEAAMMESPAAHYVRHANEYAGDIDKHEVIERYIGDIERQFDQFIAQYRADHPDLNIDDETLRQLAFQIAFERGLLIAVIAVLGSRYIQPHELRVRYVACAFFAQLHDLNEALVAGFYMGEIFETARLSLQEGMDLFDLANNFPHHFINMNRRRWLERTIPARMEEILSRGGDQHRDLIVRLAHDIELTLPEDPRALTEDLLDQYLIPRFPGYENYISIFVIALCEKYGPIDVMAIIRYITGADELLEIDYDTQPENLNQFIDQNLFTDGEGNPRLFETISIIFGIADSLTMVYGSTDRADEFKPVITNIEKLAQTLAHKIGNVANMYRIANPDHSGASQGEVFLRIIADYIERRSGEDTELSHHRIANLHFIFSNPILVRGLMLASDDTARVLLHILLTRTIIENDFRPHTGFVFTVLALTGLREANQNPAEVDFLREQVRGNLRLLIQEVLRRSAAGEPISLHDEGPFRLLFDRRPLNESNFSNVASVLPLPREGNYNSAGEVIIALIRAIPARRDMIPVLRPGYEDFMNMLLELSQEPESSLGFGRHDRDQIKREITRKRKDLGMSSGGVRNRDRSGKGRRRR